VNEVERLQADLYFAEQERDRLDHRAAMNRVNWTLWRDRATAAESALAALRQAMEALAEEWEASPKRSHSGAYVADLRALAGTSACAGKPEYGNGGCCGACKGTGSNLSDGPCWDCRGTGHPHEQADPAEPVGMTVSEDRSLINWRGENYVRQNPTCDSCGSEGFELRFSAPHGAVFCVDCFERENSRRTWVCDGCMARLVAAQIADFADFEHVLCRKCADR
jgi:hypothetical protein